MFYWLAHYKDGSHYRQGNFAEIRRDDLQAFDLYVEAGEGLVLRVDLSDGDVNEQAGIGPKRLIYRKRTRQTESGGKASYHLVGWQRTIRGVNIQAINYVFETGGMVLGGNFTGAGFQHSIEPFPFEADLMDCKSFVIPDSLDGQKAANLALEEFDSMDDFLESL